MPESHQRDIKADAALEGINDTPEDISKRAQGHKANLSNPNTSEESKERSCQELKSLGGEDAFYGKQEVEKEPSRVAAGLKATMHNPGVSKEAHESALDRLNEMEASENV